MRHHYTVRTYGELRQWAKKFAADSNLHSLIIFGTPGTGKTETFTRALDNEYLFSVKGRLTAFQLFRLLKDNLHALFLFDDTRRILKDFECVNLLMVLGEHKAEKVIQWNTSTLTKTTKKDDEEGGDDPNVAVTSSRIAIVINRVDEESDDLEPLFSRSVVIRFAPSKLEVHHYVGEWFPKCSKSRDIYGYIGEKLSLIPVSDVRDYTKSLTVYDMNWREQLNESWTGDEYLTAALQIVSDPSIPNGKPQVERFLSMCGGSRAQFFRLKTKLMPLSHEPVSKSHDPSLVRSISHKTKVSKQ
jgi:hypothetical protein